MATISATAVSARQPNGTRAILWGGLIAGVLDIIYAVVNGSVFGRMTAQGVLQSVASGWVGREAFRGGWPAATLGLASHFLIAFIWAALYYVASRKLAPLAQRPIVFGLLYGALVWTLMNGVVVPLSAAPFAMQWRWPGLLVHMFLVGLPIALAVSRYSRRNG